MIVRAGRADDIPVMAAILAANKEPIGWPDLPHLGWPYLDHLVARARTNVAEADGAVVGFGGSVGVGRDDVRFLTDLFVEPGSHGRGAGQSLLSPLLEGSVERMTFSSGNQQALGLYIRAGMRPWWPLLYVEIPAGALAGSDSGVEARPADVEETARWSDAWTGVDRSVDFAHFASLPGASGYLIEDDGAVAAVGWARRERKRADGRWLDHASLAPDADPVRIGLALLATAAGGARLMAAVPGPHPVVAPLLEGGARIRGRDQFCATDPSLVDPVRLFPNPGFL